MTAATSRPLVLGIDAGGTMTDTFIVDEAGRFEVGKAATTPDDESVGFLESTVDAIGPWGMDSVDELFPGLSVCLYSGTTMLNTLLSRRGQDVGLIVTRGFEDMLLMARGLSWAGYGYSDTLHAVTHVHPEPLTPKRRIRGVTERMDMFGEPVIPLYEAETRAAVRALLEEGAQALAVCMLFSYLNPAHELRAREIALEVMDELGRHVPAFVSSEVRPVMREQSRVNSVLIEAYAAAPVRKQLFAVQERIHERGFNNPLQTVLSYGGLANVNYPRLHETLVSGPIGGILGAQHVASLLGEENVMVSDMGGTSFDIGAITAGNVPVEPEPVLARFKLNLPTIALESIGAGSGTIVKVDPDTRKVELGPESAGAKPGPVCFAQGGERTTVCDCAAVLGYLNPDYFLGGRIKLDLDAARAALVEQVMGPIGVDLHEGAEGIVRMLEVRARDALVTVASARGLDTSDYVLMAYGGSGPLHVAGYTEGVQFKGVLTFPFAAAFSAFGCATADYLHRYTKSMGLAVAASAGGEEKAAVGERINAAWDEMEAAARQEMELEGRKTGELRFQPIAMIRYAAQLTDLEIQSPVRRIESAADLDALIGAWEALYERINSRVSKYSEAGYQIFELGLLARVGKVKPQFPIYELEVAEPPPAKGSRSVFRDGAWHEVPLWEMDELRPGNVIDGFAIVEHPATTLVIPPGHRITVDQRKFMWLEQNGGQGNGRHA
ncbi:MAG: hydantoinase/oxoprolinase family protein [Solirubrobacterales bacterium]|nr:hydantoinase/oxoprolinase family protein [Solirubrobacterales bacterium]